MAESLTPKWASEEWCSSDNTDGETFLKLTNVLGGDPSASAELKWLDFDGYFNWSREKDLKNTFFLSPDKNGYFLRWDETSGNGNTDGKDSSQLKDALCGGNYPSENTCDARSNTSNCLIGHTKHKSKYWVGSQSWNTDDEINNSDVVGDKNTYWRRGYNADGTLGPGICGRVYEVPGQKPNHKSKTYNIFYFDGSQYNASTYQCTDNSISGCGYDTTCPGPGYDYPNIFDQCRSTFSTGIHGDQSCQISNLTEKASSWISDNTAAACCGLTGTDVDKYPQCKNGAFDPRLSGTKCVEFMNSYCQTNWNACASDNEQCSTSPGVTCNNYLKAGTEPSSLSAKKNISSYINSRTPIDYISWSLKQRADDVRNTDGTYTNPSWNYYNDNNCKSDPSTYPVGDLCNRDDSTDPYFTDTLQYLCNTPQTNMCARPATGVCDEILQYWCQEFDRDDLLADSTLMNICGCSLLPSSGSPSSYDKPKTKWIGEDGQIQTWRDTTGPPQPQSPYYINSTTGDNCDPLCVNSKINQCVGVCQGTFCIIDDVTVNIINSSGGDINLQQICTNCGDSGCQCYIGDVDVNNINSDTQVQMETICDACYSFTDNNLSTAVQVNCDGTPWSPDQPTKPTQPTDDKGKSWYKNWIVVGALIIIGVLVLLGFGIGYYYRHKKVVQPEIEVYDPSDAYYNFDFSDFDFSGYQ